MANAIPEAEKSQRRFDMFLRRSRSKRLNIFTQEVAVLFQRMIRAEYGARKELLPCILDGELIRLRAPIGKCACVTCGTIKPWEGSNELHCGHCMGRSNGVLFEETAVAPQCAYCNRWLDGNYANFRRYIDYEYPGEWERLEKLKNKPSPFTREHLVDMKIEYIDRTKAAIEIMISTSENTV